MLFNRCASTRVFNRAFNGILFLFLLSGCSSGKTDVKSESGFFLGTYVTISIYDKVQESVFEKIFTLIRDYENTLSRNIEGSEISEINTNAGIKAVSVSEKTFDIIEKGIEYSVLSDGKFDLSVGPLVSLWGIGTEAARVPEKQEIEKALSLVDFRKIRIDRNALSVYLPDKGMELDCGAIAKGFIADRIKDLMLREGIESAIINLGGNILTIGGKSDNIPFRIGIQDPQSDRGEYLGILKVKDRSVVTSGTYERFYEKDGKRYHHILDTATGFPVVNNVLGISVLTDRSVDGDALSTSFFAMGIEKGLKLAESDNRIDVLYISDTNEIYLTSGFREGFELTDSSYKLISD